MFVYCLRLKKKIFFFFFLSLSLTLLSPQLHETFFVSVFIIFPRYLFFLLYLVSLLIFHTKLQPFPPTLSLFIYFFFISTSCYFFFFFSFKNQANQSYILSVFPYNPLEVTLFVLFFKK